MLQPLGKTCDCGGSTYDGVGTHTTSCKKYVLQSDEEQLARVSYEAGKEFERKRIREKIGMLRQFLNERSVNAPLLTNEAIEMWLFK